VTGIGVCGIFIPEWVQASPSGTNRRAVLSLPVEMAEEARQETVRIIKSTPPPKDNLTKTERAVLKTLKENKNLTILPADKGRQWYSTPRTRNRRSPLF
jgi:hypothetical protein